MITQDQYNKIVYLLGPKGIEAWKFTMEDNKDKEHPSKVLNRFESNFQIPNIQWSYRREAYSVKQQEDEAVEHLDIRLTNVLLKCSYP